MKIEDHIEILELHQMEGGGILASISYEPYKKVWLRDHSHVALTLYSYRRLDAAHRASNFILEVMRKEREKLKRILKIPKNDEDFKNIENHLRARYYPDLSYVEGPWAERQYDGVALSLRLLLKAVENGFSIEEELLCDIGRYLHYVWDTPCADLWESFEDYIHLETLGAIYGALLELYEKTGFAVESELVKLKKTILSYMDPIPKKMKKNLNEQPIGIDSSALFLFTHFGVLRDRNLLRRFLLTLKSRLSPDGTGLRRYEIEELGEIDTYFGGGVWCILTYLSGIAHALLNEFEEALKAVNYCPYPIPEQLVGDDYINSKASRDEWQKKEGGGPAEVLAWSHAIYLDLVKVLGKSKI